MKYTGTNKCLDYFLFIWTIFLFICTILLIFQINSSLNEQQKIVHMSMKQIRLLKTTFVYKWIPRKEDTAESSWNSSCHVLTDLNIYSFTSRYFREMELNESNLNQLGVYLSQTLAPQTEIRYFETKVTHLSF